MQEVPEPIRLVGEIDQTSFDRAGDRMHAHHLVHLCLVAYDPVLALVSQFLDELSSGGFVFNENVGCSERDPVLTDRSLQIGIIHSFPKDVKQVKLFPLDSPSRADT